MARRITQEEWDRRAAAVGIEWLEQPKNGNTPTLARCLECSHEWYPRPRLVSQGRGCPICARAARAVPQKSSTEHVSDQGLQAISPLTDSTRAVPQEWLPDPEGRHQLRWWDGKAWTEHVSDQGQQAIAPLSYSTPDPAPMRPLFNGLALAGLLVPLPVLILWAVLAGAYEGMVRPMPVVLGVPGIIGLTLAIHALGRARRGERRNRGTSVAGIVVASLAILIGFGSLATEIVNQSEDRRAAAKTLGADSDTISDADLVKYADLVKSVGDDGTYNAAAMDVFLGYQKAVDGTVADAERWLKTAPSEVVTMRFAQIGMQNLVDSMSDAGLRRSLGPLMRSYSRQTMLVGQLLGAVQTGNVKREFATQRQLQALRDDRARIVRALNLALQGLDRLDLPPLRPNTRR